MQCLQTGKVKNEKFSGDFFFAVTPVYINSMTMSVIGGVIAGEM